MRSLQVILVVDYFLFSFSTLKVAFYSLLACRVSAERLAVRQTRRWDSRVTGHVCMCVLSRVRLFAAPLDCSLPGSSVHGILQARILEWVATPSSKGSSLFRECTCVSCLLRWQASLYHERCLGSPLDKAVVQSLSHVQLFVTLWTAGFPVLHFLLEFAQTHVH